VRVDSAEEVFKVRDQSSDELTYMCNGGGIRADSGSAGHGSWVKWVDKCKWVTWVTGQYRKTLDPLLGEV